MSEAETDGLAPVTRGQRRIVVCTRVNLLQSDTRVGNVTWTGVAEGLITTTTNKVGGTKGRVAATAAAAAESVAGRTTVPRAMEPWSARTQRVWQEEKRLATLDPRVAASVTIPRR